MGKVGSIEEAVYACKLRRGVILSEAKLQRSGQSPGGQTFNLWSLLDRIATTKIRDV
jgi:hypothetical protein